MFSRLGIFDSIAASLVIFIIGYFAGNRKKFKKITGTNMSILKLAARLKKAGVLGFYQSRKDIEATRKPPTIHEYIKTAKTELGYIGLYLSVPEQNWEIFENTITEMVENNCKISFIFFGNNTDESTLKSLAIYYGLPESDLKKNIDGCWKRFLDLKRRLDTTIMGANFTIRSHSILITESAFIFDSNTENAKIFFDIKLCGLGKEKSVALEIIPLDGRDELYKNIINSFRRIEESSVIAKFPHI